MRYAVELRYRDAAGAIHSLMASELTESQAMRLAHLATQLWMEVLKDGSQSLSDDPGR